MISYFATYNGPMLMSSSFRGDFWASSDKILVCPNCATDYMFAFPLLICARGVHSLLYFAYTCVRDLFIGGIIYLATQAMDGGD
jgi:hypothetical protein